MIDLRLLRTFVCAAKSNSISAAAIQVLRTQSAVTMQIQRLEKTVGHTLFHRSGSGIRLTESGERFLVHANRILMAHDEAISQFSQKGLHGSISFGCPEDYLIAFGPALIQTFGAMHPLLEINVVSAPTAELRKLLQQRQIDLALVSTPKPGPKDEILRMEPLVWVGNKPNLALQYHDDVIPLALSASNTMDHRAACQVMERAKLGYRIAFASNSLAGLIAIARSGLAISVFTQKAIPKDLYVQGKVLPQLPEIGVLVEYAQENPSPTVMAFGKHICRNLPGL
ncbi:LysR family transcriptional regulator [Celeribacter sp.]|uniref:LysR family transcriptional regulator n=1 Tax=Celeribacter sp. TaxID=1890673 RepID=UPI003A9467CF